MGKIKKAPPLDLGEMMANAMAKKVNPNNFQSGDEAIHAPTGLKVTIGEIFKDSANGYPISSAACIFPKGGKSTIFLGKLKPLPADPIAPERMPNAA